MKLDIMNKVVALIVARNEERYIFKVISAIKNQTLRISNIVLVDDGSTDETANIAEDFECNVISLPFHENILVGNPDLAIRWNIGLKAVMEYSPDYVLLMGGDHILPEYYVEDVINNMNDDIVIASGRISGEGFNETSPRGSGRIVKTFFWINLNNMKYPISYGWESWLLFKAMKLGYETKCFRNIVTKIERKTTLRNASSLGKAMYALGYDYKYCIGRCFLTFFRSPKAGIKMLWGWSIHKDVERLDVASFVNTMQKERFWNRLLDVIKRGGRK